jgi:hypothetical protein
MGITKRAFSVDRRACRLLLIHRLESLGDRNKPRACAVTTVGLHEPTELEPKRRLGYRQRIVAGAYRL